VQAAEEMARLLREDGWHQADGHMGVGPDPDGWHEAFSLKDADGYWSLRIGAWDDPSPEPQIVRFSILSPRVDH
jgi:hypothetical protein